MHGIRTRLLRHSTATSVGGGVGIVGSLASIGAGLFVLIVGLALTPFTLGVSTTTGFFLGGR